MRLTFISQEPSPHSWDRAGIVATSLFGLDDQNLANIDAATERADSDDSLSVRRPISGEGIKW
jgi:hypothetical protein